MFSPAQADHNGEHATGVVQSNTEQFLSYDHSPTVDRTQIFFFNWIQELAKLPSCSVFKPPASLYTNNNKLSITATQPITVLLAQAKSGPLLLQLCSWMTPWDLSLPKTVKTL